MDQNKKKSRSEPVRITEKKRLRLQQESKCMCVWAFFVITTD